MKNRVRPQLRQYCSRRALVAAASVGVLAAVQPAFAQDEQEEAPDQIIVTGIRGSLQRSADMKRNANGIVDAISAEDIGKFPDTNLAESLQRITGVSIDRVNGEGSEITVRGFGSQFNLVTMNGRQMPTANVPTIGAANSQEFGSGTSRNFDFSDLASEGVTALQIYKTGQANAPTGGIGATVNVQTVRPLDREGANFTIGAKALHDTTVVHGSDWTPEVTGLASWTDPTERFGVSLFGAWQKRDSSSPGATSNAYNIRTADDFLSDGSLVRPGATINNAPSGNPYVIFPNDSRYIFDDNSRERINGLATVQFRPAETLTFTVDAFYSQNIQTTKHAEQSNWFNRPFDEVTFSGGLVPLTEFLMEDIGGAADDADPNTQSVKDMGFEQIYRSNKETLWDIGGNITWDAGDRFHVSVDGHSARAWSGPHSSNGTSATLVSIAAPVIAGHSLDSSSGFPVQQFTFNDCAAQNRGSSGGTNCNGTLDVGDLGTQVARTIANRQSNSIHQGRLDFVYDVADDLHLKFGGDFVDADENSQQVQTQQQLGDWGITQPGDVNMYAPGMVDTFCLSCQFDDYTPGNAEVVPYLPNNTAIDLNDIFAPLYAGQGNSVDVTANFNDSVQETIKAVYGQVDWKGEIGNGMPATLLLGVRYEDTIVSSTSLQPVPQAIVWQSDNDFKVVLSNTMMPVSQRSHYNNLLPSVDFSLEFMPNVIARASYSETLSRPNYSNLFARTTVNTPPGSTAFGSEATGSRGDPSLAPLISNNFDISLEWYPNEASYFSIGFFDKRVRNFVGTSVVSESLFGLGDPSSGATGTRSGDAATIISDLGLTQSDVSLFTLTALVDQYGAATALAMAQDPANLTPDLKDFNQSFVDATLAAYDVTANGADPLFSFATQVPVNNKEGKIHGIEVAGQYFFGETGFGVQANYTKVDGDVNAALDSNPNVDQFALLGLSDTANATLIYEKFGISARLAFNWRGSFLTQLNVGGTSRNPIFVDSFKELDAQITYDVTEHIQLSFEGLNLTSEDLRTHSRNQKAFVTVQELGPRFLFGARYRF